jgi:hypothetical protein
MNSVFSIVDNQISINRNINLFYEKELFRFSQNFLDEISNIEIDSIISFNYIIDNVTNNILKEFYRVNQYYSFDEEAKQELKLIYTDLYNQIKQKAYSKEYLACNHCKRLKVWLQKANPFAEKIYPSTRKIVTIAPCFEYTPALQLEILKLDLSQLIEPVLDLGCGQKGYLVNYLRERGIESYGIDRYDSDCQFIINSDWLKYDLGVEKWGTIISNLGFSNHFLHHHLREDGKYIDYAKKYMSILNSLKPNGKFHYAPSLPFIEQYLDRNKFSLTVEKTVKCRTTIIRKVR